MMAASGAASPSGPVRAIVVMGVAGSGKSVVGSGLADKLDWRFVEGDDLHPAENVARMKSGLPLTDANRWGWLDAIAARMTETLADGAGVVVSCSALKRDYRDRLRQAVGDILFVYLEIDAETARRRVSARKGHFMPASLVESQFADLEPPETDERRLVMNGTRRVADVVRMVAGQVRKLTTS